jgi:hypothetical protein
MGNDIEGEAASDYSGYDIALNGPGDKVVIGATDAKNNGSFTVGHLRVYSWNGTAWFQQGSDLDGLDAGEQLGRSVAINYSGSRVAGGSPYRPSGYSSGAVTVWEWNGNSWNVMDTSILGDHNYEVSGFDVSLDSLGNTLAIASLSAEDSLGIKKGAIRIFYWTGSSWIMKGLKLFGSNEDDYFGRSVSLSADGNTVAAGASDNNNDKGYVRIFDWSGSSWVQRGNDIEGESIGDNSGKAISLSADGNTIAIGSPENSDNGSSSGHVRVFSWDGSTWQQVGSAFEGTGAGDDFGKSVSVTNNARGLAVGGPRNSDSGYLAGHVRVYHYSGIGLVEAVQNTTLIYPNPSSGTVTLDLSRTKFLTTLSVYYLSGELVDKIELQPLSKALYKIDGPKGIYVFKFTSEDGMIHIERMVKY